jgi:hypothetical protein
MIKRIMCNMTLHPKTLHSYLLDALVPVPLPFIFLFPGLLLERRSFPFVFGALCAPVWVFWLLAFRSPPLEAGPLRTPTASFSHSHLPQRCSSQIAPEPSPFCRSSSRLFCRTSSIAGPFSAPPLCRASNASFNVWGLLARDRFYFPVFLLFFACNKSCLNQPAFGCDAWSRSLSCGCEHYPGFRVEDGQVLA